MRNTRGPCRHVRAWPPPEPRSRGASAAAHDRKELASMAIDRPPIQPLVRAFRQQYHTAAQLDRIKQATLDILETVGVKVPSPSGRSGCSTRPAPPSIAGPRSRSCHRTWCSRTWPGRRGTSTLGARDATLRAADRRRHHLLHHRRLRRQDRRLGHAASAVSTKADLARVTRLQDYLSSISFWWPTVSAGDRGETAQLHELDAGWNNTVKHLQGMVNGARASQLRGRDGDGHRRQRRGAAPPPGALRPHRHHLAAGARPRRHRGGAWCSPRPACRSRS